MGDEAKRLADLIGSVADGNAIDWKTLDGFTTDEALPHRLRDLRTIAGVAEVHRTQIEEGDAGVGVQRDRTVPAGALGRWGHFLLVEKIGEGTFGEVYHARDTWLDHAVALKLLKPALADRSRILHEARTLVQVRHPNVVVVHGADVHDGRLGFWMEFIQGHTLAEVVVREGVRSASEAAIMGQDLCRALAAVHATGIIHRDIKAQNVMRQSGTGRVVLMDFGAGEIISARQESASRLTGTPLYFAPELFFDGPATFQTDIYALGVLLFYLVTGSYPVQEKSLADLVRAHARSQRRHLGDMRPDLPDTFVRAVDTMLARDPAARYASAARTRAALEAVVVPAASLPAAVLPPVPSSADGASAYGVRAHDAWRSHLLSVAVAIAATAIVLTFTGFVTSILYNGPLGRTEGFETETPWSWPLWGLRALLASAVVMVGIAVAWIILRLICRLVLTMLRPVRPLTESTTRLFARVRSAPGATLASAVLLAQIGAVALFAWQFQSLFQGLDSFISQRPPVNLAPLGPENQQEHVLFGTSICLQVLGFGLIWLRLLQQSRGPRVHSDAMALIVGGIAITAVSFLVGQIIPFRILYHNDAERVSYDSSRCYLVGQRGTEARLFCPTQSPPWNRVVNLDDPALEREGIYENIFTGLKR